MTTEARFYCRECGDLTPAEADCSCHSLPVILSALVLEHGRDAVRDALEAVED